MPFYTAVPRCHWHEALPFVDFCATPSMWAPPWLYSYPLQELICRQWLLGTWYSLGFCRYVCAKITYPVICHWGGFVGTLFSSFLRKQLKDAPCSWPFSLSSCDFSWLSHSAMNHFLILTLWYLLGQALGTSHGAGDTPSDALPQREGERLSGKQTTNRVNNNICVTDENETGGH